jgi:hypothetical protein
MPTSRSVKFCLSFNLPEFHFQARREIAFFRQKVSLELGVVENKVTAGSSKFLLHDLGLATTDSY